MLSATRWLVDRAGSRALRVAAWRRLALRAAAARGRSLVLLYHRITPEGRLPHEVIPTVSAALFTQHLEALRELGEIVPLAALLQEPADRHRVRFAITFDDDERSHVDHALPALEACGVHATIFVSGRSLHGLRPYWWLLLEQLIASVGPRRAGSILGLAGDTPERLAAACEGSPAVAHRLTELVDAPSASMLRAEDFRTLADAGMTLGFHTVRHPVLTTLPDEAIEFTIRDGRRTLSEVVGAPIDLFAYPHGRADARVAHCVRAAGYQAAVTTRRRPIASGSDPFLLGRWEPGPLSPTALSAQVALRLNYPPHARRE